eukprot:5402857-Alexandrium_andersonii.AAC.2
MQSFVLEAPCEARRLQQWDLVLGEVSISSEFRTVRRLFRAVCTLCTQPSTAGFWVEFSG